jgi:hypothetical protein
MFTLEQWQQNYTEQDLSMIEYVEKYGELSIEEYVEFIEEAQ